MSLHRHPLLIRYGRFCFRYRGTLFPVVLALLCAVFWPDYLFGDEALDRWVDLGALILVLLGQSVRAATIGLEYIIRGGRDKRPYAEGLVTTGIFAHVRNPLYVGNLLLVVGLLALTGRVETFALGLAFILVCYVAMVASEEDFLRAKFGAEFETYCARVPRWIPVPRGLLRTFRSMSFNWRRVILTDFGTVYGWVSIGAAIEAAETVREWSGADDWVPLIALAAIWLLTSLAYLAVRRARSKSRASSRAPG